jgi:hypothetical protein
MLLSGLMIYHELIFFNINVNAIETIEFKARIREESDEKQNAFNKAICVSLIIYGSSAS